MAGHERAYVDRLVCAGRSSCPHPADILAASAAALRRPGHLRAAFSAYAALASDAVTNRRKAAAGDLVRVPVLAVGGANGVGELPAASLRDVAVSVTGAVVPGANHWLIEEYPQALLEVLLPFLGTPGAGVPGGQVPRRSPQGN